MANIQESAAWEGGIFRVETTTPWIGGEEGTANVQAKQLARRTLWLKQAADEVIAARGGKANLAARLEQYDALDPASVSAVVAYVAGALDLAGLANREAAKTVRQRMQAGTATVANRGVVSGCTASKSATAVRNLSVSGGVLFARGMEVGLPAAENAAMVPANYSGSTQYAYAYAWLDGAGNASFACTPLAEPVPDGAVPLYRITVPAGNTDINAPHLESVTLTDVRRMEVNWPLRLASQAYQSVALPYVMPDSDYTVLLETPSVGGVRGAMHVGDKAVNGFKIYADDTADGTAVRWIAVKLNL